jgi:hypothetical protein
MFSYRNFLVNLAKGLNTLSSNLLPILSERILFIATYIYIFCIHMNSILSAINLLHPSRVMNKKQ